MDVLTVVVRVAHVWGETRVSFKDGLAVPDGHRGYGCRARRDSYQCSMEGTELQVSQVAPAVACTTGRSDNHGGQVSDDQVPSREPSGQLYGVHCLIGGSLDGQRFANGLVLWATIGACTQPGTRRHHRRCKCVHNSESPSSLEAPRGDDPPQQGFHGEEHAMVTFVSCN